MRHFIYASIVLCFISLTASANSLGIGRHNDSSMESDAVAIGASHQMIPKGLYNLHVVTAGCVIYHYYAALNGDTFKATAQGCRNAPVASIAGELAGETTQAISARPLVRHSRIVSVSTGNISYSATGHGNYHYSWAVAPAYVPAGVNVKELK